MEEVLGADLGERREGGRWVEGGLGRYYCSLVRLGAHNLRAGLGHASCRCVQRTAATASSPGEYAALLDAEVALPATQSGAREGTHPAAPHRMAASPHCVCSITAHSHCT